MPLNSGKSPTAKQKYQQNEYTQEFSFHAVSFPRLILYFLIGLQVTLDRPELSHRNLLIDVPETGGLISQNVLFRLKITLSIPIMAKQRELSARRRRIYKAHPCCGGRTLWSRAHSSRMDHTSDPVPLRRPTILDSRRSWFIGMPVHTPSVATQSPTQWVMAITTTAIRTCSPIIFHGGSPWAFAMK